MTIYCWDFPVVDLDICNYCGEYSLLLRRLNSWPNDCVNVEMIYYVIVGIIIILKRWLYWWWDNYVNWLMSYVGLISLIMILILFDEVNVLMLMRWWKWMIILPCNHPYLLEGLTMFFGNVFVKKKMIYLGGRVSCQNSTSLKRPKGFTLLDIFLSITSRFWLQMTCQSGENYFLRGLVNFQCIWDGLLLMVKL